MAEHAMRPRNGPGLTQAKLRAELEAAENEAAVTRLMWLRHINRQLAQLIGRYNRQRFEFAESRP